MRLARIEHDGDAVYASVDGDQLLLIDGNPFGSHSVTDTALPLDGATLLCPSQPSKILAMAVNYRSHGEPVAVPQPFLKTPSSVIGPEVAIELPRDAERVDEEGEVVAVIGRRTRNITVDQVDAHVFGYTCGNDVSARDWQRADRQWWRAKSADTFTVVGPWIETDLDPAAVGFRARLNGESVQEANTSELVFSIRECIAFISQAMTLEPGDLVFTGTPGTTAQLSAGDVIEVEVDGVGVLRNPVVDAP
ncbi:MAG: fumarylacetoacetate hydrolase family protein [Chloroflexi bacterium]|nr:fumarylacetoacetate hydrolase family protein [Chloroflexota bacterium]